MRRALPLLALAACAPEGASDLEAPAASDGARLSPLVAGLTLAVGVPHPGGELSLATANARPGESVAFWASAGGIAAGAGPCVAQLGGLCLDLGANTAYLGQAVADGAGRAVFTGLVPLTLQPGTPLTFQSAVRRGQGGATSVRSNPVARAVGAPAWSHTVGVDGSLADWRAEELFATTSGGGTLGGVTWDATHLYVAFVHPDIQTGGPQHWEVVTLGTGAPGSLVGTPLNTQQPGLPFEATLQVRRKADGSYDDLQRWDEAAQSWARTPSFLGTQGSSVAESGDVLELALPRALLGSGPIQVVLSQVYEGNGFESTYAGVPADAYVDGYDPDLATWLDLDFHVPDAPAVQNP